MSLDHDHDQFEYLNEFMERIQNLKPQEQEVVKDFWRSLVMRTQRAFSEENGRLHGAGSTANMRSCSCCPYGYHIDLDFVRYCESLASAAAKPSEEQLRRRSRRRSRKSMEFMLGLESLFDQWDAAERVQMVPEAPHEMEPESPKRNQSQSQTQPLLSITRYEDEENNNTKVALSSPPPPAAPKRSSSVPRFTYGGMTPSTCSSSGSSRVDGGSSDVFVIPPLRPTNSPPETRAFLRDALDEVCSDFERTLERTSMKRKKAGCGDGDWGGVGGGGMSPAGHRSGSSDRNNNFMSSPGVTQKRSCHTWDEYVDALDSCVSGNKSPRGSRVFTRSATLPLPPSPHKQQQQQQAQQQYESYVQATVAANAATTALQACIPPPPPPRRHLGRLRRSLTPDQLTRSPLSEKLAAGLSASPANTDVAGTDAQTLFNIRQQMALSLKRMKSLEEQVKSIPELQNELSQLRDERQRLQSTLQRKEEDELQRARDASRLSASPSPAASPKYASPVHFTPQRISPITLESVGARMRTNSTSSERQLKATLKRDVATMCLLHATRDIAVGTPMLTTRSIGSSPLQKLGPSEVLYTRGELDDHAEKALKSHKEKQLKKLISIGTQMYVPKRDVRDMSSQTVAERPVQKFSVGVSVKPATRENYVTCKPDVRSVACSEDRISDVLCKQCVVSKRSVACGTDASLIQGEAAVSLKLMDMPGRSKTFSLGDNEKLPLIKRKTVGTQYTPFMIHSAGAQTTMTMVHSVGVQHVPEMDNSATQSDAAEVATRQTDTRDLVQLRTSQTVREEVMSPAEPPPKAVVMRSSASNTEILKTTENGEWRMENTARPAALRHAACNTQQVATRDFGCGDIVKPHISIACADNYCDSCKDAIKHLAKDFSKLPPPSPVSPRAVDSRIPRPTHLTSPSPVRKKFQRQNTYTITPSPTPSPSPVAERRNILSTLHEKSTSLNKPTALELSPERKPNASPRSRTSSTGSRIAELESIFTKKAIKSYEISDTALDENPIVKEEKCVRINWARAATPTKSHHSLSHDQMSPVIGADRSAKCSSPEEEEDDEEQEQIVKQEKDVSTGARPKSAAPQKSSQSDFSATTNLSVGVETTTSGPRERMEPSKELYDALKVVNESLRKATKSSSMSNNITAAKSIVQQEWFQVASTELSRPKEVRDYLDAFRAFSVPLLEYCVNMMDNNGNTVLHYAVSHGNFGVVSLLLDSKVCNVNQMNNAGYTSVMLVSLAKLKDDAHRSVVQRLFRMADINVKAKKHSQTALMLAVSHGNHEMVEMLLAAGADINIQDDDGSTALMCSAEHERLDIVKLLLSQPECDSLKQDVDGSTAFKIAWQAGHRDVGLLLYMHEQMLRSKLQQRSGDSGSSRTPSLSPRNHKRQPSQ